MVLEDDSQPLVVTAISSSSRRPAATLISQGGVIGYVKEGEVFQPRTNFTVEVVGCLKMEGYIVGYLFSINRNDDDTTRLVFYIYFLCSEAIRLCLPFWYVDFRSREYKGLF